MLNARIDTKELENNIREIVRDVIKEEIEKALIHHLYDEEIKGYELASRMLNVSESTLKSRVQNGYYIKGRDYTKKESKQCSVFFYKNKILKTELKK